MSHRRIGYLVMATAAQSAVAAHVLADGRMDEVVVVARPIRDSDTAAIEAKRSADNVVDVISADTIGRFPDQNLADSLGRLPGLAIERDQGQSRYINFRGAPFRYTGIAFDGVSVPGAENGRVPRFDAFPSVITSRIEAHKAVLPSMPGDAVAGYIDVHTFNPFDTSGVGVAVDAGTGEQDLGGGSVEKAGLRTSWSNDRIGVLAFGSRNSREQVTDNREYDLAGQGSDTVVNELDFRSYKVERKDQAWGGRVELRGADVLERLFASTLYSEFVDNEERNQFVFAMDALVAGIAREDAAMTVTRALEYGEYMNSTLTSTLGADLAIGGWKVESRLNHTETEFGMDLPIVQSRGGVITGAYDVSSAEDPIVTLESDLGAVVYPVTLGLRYLQSLDVDANLVKLDAARNVRWLGGRDARLAAGLKRDTREGTGFVATPVIGAFPDGIDIDAFDTGRAWHANTTNSIGGTYYDNIGLRRAWAASGTLPPAAVAPENMIAIEEDVLALYAMVTTDFDWGNLIVGARLERTEYSSAGTSPSGPVFVSGDFDELLPSVHLNVDLAEDLRWRVAATTGLGRPTYGEWRAAAVLDIPSREIRGGNPTLKPEETLGLDTSLEWYFAPASLLSAGAFYRTVDHVIHADSAEMDAGLYLPGAAGETWTYIGSVNGSDGRLRGLELSFVGNAAGLLPAPLDGFGLSANVTLLDSEFKDIDGLKHDLPGTSDLIYNVSLFYEKHGFSIRLNYQYRDEWISPIEDPSEYWGEQKRLDLTTIYMLPLNLGRGTVSFYANVNNLTDETDVRYAGNGTLNQSESYGRHFLAGFRVNY